MLQDSFEVEIRVRRGSNGKALESDRNNRCRQESHREMAVRAGRCRMQLPAACEPNGLLGRPNLDFAAKLHVALDQSLYRGYHIRRLNVIKS